MKSISAGLKSMLNKMNPLARQAGLGDVLAECVEKGGIMVKPGVSAAATINLGLVPNAIVAVLAVTTATGAFATKALLAVTTDYTINLTTGILTCVTNQSAATLIIVYR